MKPYKLNKHSRRHWPKLVLFVGVTALLLGALGFLGIKNLYERNLRAVDSSSHADMIFVVESGMSAPEIADGLEDQKIIRSARAFNQYVRSNELGEAFIAGTYRLKQSMDVPTIVDYLTEGKVAVDLFTILPAKNLEQIKAAFVKEGYADAEVQAALNPALYSGHPALVDKPASASLEGYLYPDSYQMLRGETRPETIIGQSLDEMAEALTPEVRAGMAAQGLSVYQGIILASIVEREVSNKNPNDRPQAAQVFLKRLRIGMPLQSNATDDYPPEYDTYSIAALPPGPISNVSASSLQAVANPAKTDHLYFVAGCDGVTRFSSTIDQHEALKSQHGISGVTCE